LGVIVINLSGDIFHAPEPISNAGPAPAARGTLLARRREHRAKSSATFVRL
jgi:hypothetical protein